MPAYRQSPYSKPMVAAMALVLILLLAAPLSAAAHEPVFFGGDNRILELRDGSTSRAAFGRFRQADEPPLELRFTLDKGERFSAVVVLPDVAPEQDLVAAKLPLLTLAARDPDASPGGEIVTSWRAEPLDETEVVKEPASDSEFRLVARVTQTAPESGAYVLFVVPRAPARVVLGLGTEEDFHLEGIDADGEDAAEITRWLATPTTQRFAPQGATPRSGDIASIDPRLTDVGTFDDEGGGSEVGERPSIIAPLIVIAAMIALAIWWMLVGRRRSRQRGIERLAERQARARGDQEEPSQPPGER